jgi:putative hydrolase of the HAD superfamily
MAVADEGQRAEGKGQRRGAAIAVLIDLDDTLFDHRASARRALQAAASADPALGRWAFDALEARHRAILEDLHRRVLDGGMTVDEARALRFRTLVSEQGEACDDARLDRLTSAYRGAYQSGWECLAGARALLAELRARGARIAIVTNNIVSEQVNKLRRLELEPFVDALVVSEAVGASKPDRRIFAHALDAVGARASEAVMLGDNWKADIEGALAAGIRGVWFNPRGLPRPVEIEGVDEVASLEPASAVADVLTGAAR